MSTTVNDELVEFVDEVCGIYFRSIVLPEGTLIAQHTHDHDHATLVCSGAVRLYIEGGYAGEYRAGIAIPVRAGSKHSFLSLEPNTRLCCIHDAKSAEGQRKLPLRQDMKAEV